MKRRISAFFTALTLIISFMPSVFAVEYHFVEEVGFSTEKVTVSGKADGEFVSVALLKPGVTLSQLNSVETGEEMKERVEYTNIITVGDGGNYEHTFDARIEPGRTYTLYLNDGISEYSKSLYIEAEGFADFITYEDKKVTVTGHTAAENEEVTVSLSADGQELWKKSFNSGDKGNYVCAAEYELAENKVYDLVISTAENSYEHHSVRLPRKIYVKPGQGDGQEVFDTIEAARDFLRSNLKDVPAEVIIEGGDYRRETALTFTAADARTIDTAVTYKSADGKRANLNGRKTLDISGFEKVTDEAVRGRMYEEVRDKVVVTNLKEQNVSDKIINFTKAYDDPDIVGETVVVPEIFLNGERQTLAQWPNEGYRNITNIVSAGSDKTKTDDAYKTDGAVFGFDKAVISRWTDAKDMFIEGFLRYTYISEWAKVGEVNRELGQIALKYRTLNGLVKATEYGPTFKAVNLLEEIDMPGEWYIDRESGLFYYYPPHELTDDDVLEVAQLCDDLIRCEDTEYIAFEGLEISENFDETIGYGLKGAYENGIDIQRSNNILIKDCYLHNLAANAVCVSDESTRVRVEDCVINNIGQVGTAIYGGESDTLASCGSIVTGCDISKVCLNQGGNRGGAVSLRCIGGIAEGNTIHSTRSNAVDYDGSENLIKHNEIYYTSTETGDSGAIYSGRTWKNAGNVIEENIIHDMSPAGDVGKDRWMVYWDDGLAGNTLRRNILIGTPGRADVGGMLISQGPENKVYDNIFVNFDGEPIDTYSIEPEFMSSVSAGIDALPYNSELYIKKYPYFKTLAALKLSSENTSERNYAGYRENLIIEGNLSLGNKLVYNDPESINAKKWAAYGKTGGIEIKENGNVLITDTDCFVDPQNGDYRLKNGTQYSDTLPTEANFDMSVIGCKKLSAEEYAEFEALSPQNGEAVGKTELTLLWEESPLADGYTYEVASDSNFENIVATGDTLQAHAYISGLSEDRVYYWRVTAKNAGIRNGFEKLCGNVYVFTTGTEPIGVSYGELSAKDATGRVYETVSTGNTVAVYDTVSAPNGETQDITYIFAAYSGKTLVFAKFDKVSVTPSVTEQKVMEFTVPENVSGADYRIMRWDGLTTMRPLN